MAEGKKLFLCLVVRVQGSVAPARGEEAGGWQQCRRWPIALVVGHASAVAVGSTSSAEPF